MIKKSNGEKTFAIFNYIFLSMLAFSTLYPFLYTLSMSLSTTVEASREGLHLFPKQITLISYSMVLRNADLFSAYLNSIMRTVVGTIAALLVTCMYAYPLSRREMPLKPVFSFILIFTMFFSGGTIPSYLLVRDLGLLNNRLVYILPGLISAFNVIIIQNYFKSIPESLPESAKIDGANDFYILFRIILPLSKPVLATVALWLAVGHWNSWFDGMLYITDNSKQILQIFLRRVVLENSTDMISQGLVNPDLMQFTGQTIISAIIIVAIVPILLVYPFVQSYFVKGIMLGSVKG